MSLYEAEVSYNRKIYSLRVLIMSEVSLTVYSCTVQYMHTTRRQLEYLHESIFNSGSLYATPSGRIDDPVVSGPTHENL
jgi:hypothetical protein